MVPVLAFAVLLSAVLLKQDNAMVQRCALDRARAMTSAVDAMLGGAVTTVKALASSSCWPPTISLPFTPRRHACLPRNRRGRTSR